MGCNNCPDANTPTGVLFIVYAGGPPHTPFAAMRAAVPNDTIIRRYRPVVHPDGRIEYNRDVPAPPVPEGYRANDPWILQPVWVSCIFRGYRVQTLDDGTLKIEASCFQAKSGTRGHEIITNDFCHNCPVRNGPIKSKVDA